MRSVVSRRSRGVPRWKTELSWASNFEQAKLCLRRRPAGHSFLLATAVTLFTTIYSLVPKVRAVFGGTPCHSRSSTLLSIIIRIGWGRFILQEMVCVQGRRDGVKSQRRLAVVETIG